MIQNVLIQLFLAALAFAAPITDGGDGTLHAMNKDMIGYGTGGGIVGLIVLVLDVLVFIEVLKSNRPPSHKLLWCLIVFLFPILGMLIYFLFSNREAHKTGGAYEPLP
ncbi:hypothetical protein AYO20_07626 [Fonsecaea nubica]|uniref:Cardiolipin synthase N-terminal domain-containing protein n=1 Tax=Fonsecaea nubica TaxID=856822 RepID=A0A178CV60_9EURO|nr:hypothetical protein AYO20_07626 [Fonsecaea nubica]OAL33144.1 hypothetical protein AYO20_07626 [Fonsecaea nubica]